LRCRCTSCAIERDARAGARPVHPISDRAVHATPAPGFAPSDTAHSSEVPQTNAVAEKWLHQIAATTKDAQTAIELELGCYG
jgi:hypothetical protein